MKSLPPNKLASLAEDNEMTDGGVADDADVHVNPSTTRTPTTSSPPKPATEEMHPSLYHSTNKKLAAEQRFGFSIKAGAPAPQQTPTKQTSAGQIPAAPQTEPVRKFSTEDATSSDAYPFTFRHPSTELSNEAQKIMDSVRGEAERIRTQLAAQREEQIKKDGNADRMFGGRRIAQPKGKLGRFSDVHVEHFKKMESIANHPSAFRADATKASKIPGSQGLKRTKSKADLDDGPETPKSLRRADSKRSIANTPKSAQSSVKLLDSNTPTQGPSKRRKTLYESKEAAASVINSGTPQKSTKDNEQSGLQKTPEAQSKIPSLARSPSTKSLKIQSMEEPNTPHKASPKPLPATPQTAPPARGIFASKLAGMKSILRKPQLKFSNDPLKQAAGTHVSPQKSSGVIQNTTGDPVTSTPANRTEKHVNFSPEPARVISDILSPGSNSEHTQNNNASPSPVKKSNMAGLNVEAIDPSTPTRTISYPSLAAASAPPKTTVPGDFTFRATSTSALSFAPSPPKDAPLNLSFAPSPPKNEPSTPKTPSAQVSPVKLMGPPKLPAKAVTPTIRKVRASDAAAMKSPEKILGVAHGLSNKKRKRDLQDVGSKNDTIAEMGRENENKENTPSKSSQSPEKPANAVTEAAAETPAKRIKLASPSFVSPRGTPTPNRVQGARLGTPQGKLGTPSPSKRFSAVITPGRMGSPSVGAGGSARKKIGAISWGRLNALAQPKKRG